MNDNNNNYELGWIVDAVVGLVQPPNQNQNGQHSLCGLSLHVNYGNGEAVVLVLTDNVTLGGVFSEHPWLSDFLRTAEIEDTRQLVNRACVLKKIDGKYWFHKLAK